MRGYCGYAEGLPWFTTWEVELGEGSEGPTTVSRSSEKGKRLLVKLGTSGGSGCQTWTRWRSSTSSMSTFQTAPSGSGGGDPGWDIAEQTRSAKDRRHISLCILLILIMWARELQHIWQLVIGSTPKMRRLGSIMDSMDVNLSKLWEMVKDREAWRASVHGAAKSRTQVSDWTTTTKHTEEGRGRQPEAVLQKRSESTADWTSAEMRGWAGGGLTSKTRSESPCLPIVVLLFKTKKPSALFR